MTIDQELQDEMHVLMLFDLNNLQDGIKIHKEAKPEIIQAGQRLFKKALITQEDGGYLTDLGRRAAEHGQSLISILRSA